MFREVPGVSEGFRTPQEASSWFKAQGSLGKLQEASRDTRKHQEGSGILIISNGPSGFSPQASWLLDTLENPYANKRFRNPQTPPGSLRQGLGSFGSFSKCQKTSKEVISSPRKRKLQEASGRLKRRQETWTPKKLRSLWEVPELQEVSGSLRMLSKVPESLRELQEVWGSESQEASRSSQSPQQAFTTSVRCIMSAIVRGYILTGDRRVYIFCEQKAPRVLKPQEAPGRLNRRQQASRRSRSLTKRWGGVEEASGSFWKPQQVLGNTPKVPGFSNLGFWKPQEASEDIKKVQKFSSSPRSHSGSLEKHHQGHMKKA